MSKVENATTQACLDFLKLRGWFAWRQGGQPVFDKASNAFRKKPKGSINGVSDIIALEPGGLAWFIEIKNPSIGQAKAKGRLSEAQRDFRDGVISAGHRFLIVYRLDDLIEALKLNQLMKQPQTAGEAAGNRPPAGDHPFRRPQTPSKA